MVAIDVDGLPFIDGTRHKCDAVLECHWQVDIVLMVEGEYSFENSVVGGIEIWVRWVSTVIYFVKGIFEFAHENGVPATELALNIREHLRKLVYYWHTRIHDR